MTDTSELRRSTLDFIESQQMPEYGVGAYRYASGCSEPTLYSSTYAAMTRSLYGDLNQLANAEREGWVSYLNRFQDEDGLYRDPVTYNQGWYKDDPLWCGRPHLTCHVVTALACLGGVAEKPLRFLDMWRCPDRMRKWLAERDWGERVAWSGNEIMNVGTLLQYARDFQNDHASAEPMAAMLEWLSTNHINPETGVWGDLDVSDPIWRSHAVQAAYHWWPLFFYDGYPIPYLERAMDTVLATQNPLGGFGWGVHNSASPYHSSACEDIDSIDPLARMSTESCRREHERSKCLHSKDLELPDTRRSRWAEAGKEACVPRDADTAQPSRWAEAGKDACVPRDADTSRRSRGVASTSSTSSTSSTPETAPSPHAAAPAGHRTADIQAALSKAAEWVLRNRTPDGGFVFVLDRPFEYGHPQFRGERNSGAMFPTWFRTLSLAIIGKALPDHPLGQYEWQFVRCPGYQFWYEKEAR
jgi:hypothetical protein